MIYFTLTQTNLAIQQQLINKSVSKSLMTLGEFVTQKTQGYFLYLAALYVNNKTFNLC